MKFKYLLKKSLDRHSQLATQLSYLALQLRFILAFFKYSSFFKKALSFVNGRALLVHPSIKISPLSSHTHTSLTQKIVGDYTPKSQMYD
jgi:hypothetical protein